MAMHEQLYEQHLVFEVQAATRAIWMGSVTIFEGVMIWTFMPSPSYPLTTKQVLTRSQQFQFAA